jgi:hypothetical protein|tara:strand:+ start:70 stop:561 length:492 start_codon:yes stop_codon:yes gene_type:complete
MPDQRLTEVRGTVKSYKPLTNTQAHIELHDKPGVYHLSISQYWSLNTGDDISLVCDGKTGTGFADCIAYKNHTRGVSGWLEGVPKDFFTLNPQKSSGFRTVGMVLIVLGALLCFTVVGAIVGIPLIVIGWQFRKPFKAFNSFLPDHDESREKTLQQARELVQQ